MNLRTIFQPRSERAFFALAALLFTAMVLVNYGPVFIGTIPLPGHLLTQFPVWAEFKSREPWQAVADIGDLIDYFYPFNAFSANQVRHRTIPLWNPFLMSGMPFQAEPQSALFYPLHALYYLFSTPTAWSVALILRTFLGAMFMTLLLRSIGATKSGAVISGIAFAFGGFMVAWQGAVMGDTVMWLPLVCYSVHRLHTNRSRGSLSLVAFSFAMPILAGHPETAIHVVLTGTAGAILLWGFPPGSQPRFDMRFLAAFSLAGIIAIGLSAVQLLPTLDWISQSGRNLNAPWDSFELHQALGFFSRDALRGPNSAGIFVPNAMGYVGMLTLLAAALAPLHRSSRYVLWFMSLIIIGIAGTFGLEPIRSILTHTPIIKGLKNERLFLLVDFGLAALAGLGISMLLEERSSRSSLQRVLPWLLVSAAFTLAMTGVHKLQLATQFKVEFMRRPSFSRTLLLCAFILIAWKLIRKQRAKLFPLVACALLVFDLGSFAYGYTGFTWRDEVFPPVPVFDFLKAQGGAESFRIAPIGLTYPSNSALAYGLQSVTGFEAGVPQALQRFILGLNEVYPDRVSLLSERVLSTQDRRFDMLNAKYVIVTTSGPDYEMFSQHPDRFSQIFKREKVAVFQNKRALPRAFIIGVAGVRLVKGDTEQIEAVKHPTFDPLETVVMESLPEELSEVRSGTEFSGSVEIVDSDVNRYHFRVQASTPGVLVVSQNFYPGWKATVNGRSVSVFPADHALTGIALPEGHYDLHFAFQPSSFKLGAVLSIISVSFLAALLGSIRPRKRW
jgi:Bacterial membrane protein YfhO